MCRSTDVLCHRPSRSWLSSASSPQSSRSSMSECDSALTSTGLARLSPAPTNQLFSSPKTSHTPALSSKVKTLAHCLENYREENLYSYNAINTADTIVKECLEVFRKMDGALRKRTSRMGYCTTNANGWLCFFESQASFQRQYCNRPVL